MRPSRLHPPRLLLAAALVGALALAGCSSSDGGDASSSGPLTPAASGGGPDQRIQAHAGLPLAQAGPDAASSDEATAAVTVDVAPDAAGAEGRRVQLQSRSGGAWKVVDDGRLDADGRASLSAPGGSRSDLRVVAAEQGDFAADASPTLTLPEPDFSDEFDGSEVGDSWVQRGQEYNPSGLRVCSKGSPDAVQVSGGELSLSVMKDPDRSDRCEAKKANGASLGDFPYLLNANMATIRTFRYGTFAARVKFQRNAGQHGSFWLQSTLGPGTGAPKTAGAEVDIVEFFGAKPDKRLASFIYYYPAPGAEAIKEGAFIPQARSFLTGEDDDWWKNYHVFALHWTPQRYTILIDGRPAWSTGKGVSQHEEMMVLSLLSSDYELPLLDGELPQTMKVDWVKHWASD